MGLLILHFVHLKFIWFDGGVSDWCAYVKRLKNRKMPMYRLIVEKKNARDYCKFSEWIEKKALGKPTKFTQITRTNFTNDMFVCIEFRNIGKLNTCHLIFAFQNSVSSSMVQLRWHHTKMIAGLLLLMLRCCFCFLFYWRFSVDLQPVDVHWFALET